MDLKEVFHIARSLKDYDDFKAFIDEEFNGTPTTVVDNTQYKLVTLGLPPFMCSCKEKQRQALIDMMQADEESGHHKGDCDNVMMHLANIEDLVNKLFIADVVQQSELLLCKHCDSKKALHSEATGLCPDRFKHFEAK